MQLRGTCFNFYFSPDSFEQRVALQVENVKRSIAFLKSDGFSKHSATCLRTTLLSLASTYHSAVISSNEDLSNRIIKAALLYSAVFQIEKGYLKDSPPPLKKTTFSELQQLYLEKAFHIQKSPHPKNLEREIEAIRCAAKEEVYNLLKEKSKSLEEITLLYLELSEKTSEKVKNFYKRLVETCLAEVSPPPCEFAFVVFGSLANQSATPYSDIEFAILLDTISAKEAKDYFRKLSCYIALNLIALNESILPFDEFNFSLDFMMRKGVSLDLGGKTPMNRKSKEEIMSPGIHINKGDDLYDLIGTPQEIAKYLNDEYFDLCQLLPIVVASNAFLHGDPRIYEAFNNDVQKHFSSSLVCKSRGKKLLSTDLEKYKPQGMATDKPLLIKTLHSMIRHLIDDLALCERIVGGTTWGKIEKLGLLTTEKRKRGIKCKKAISSEGEINLKIAYSIIQFLRLRVYLESNCQSSKAFRELLQDTTEVSDKDFENLYHFFFRALPFYENLLSYFYQNTSLKQSTFYDDSKNQQTLIELILKPQSAPDLLCW